MNLCLNSIRPLGWGLVLAGLSLAMSSVADTLTNAAMIRSLSAPEAARALPVRLTGVMMGAMLQSPQSTVLADGTAGIFVTEARDKRGLFARCRRGDVLEITGVTDAGEFAPVVLARTVRQLPTQPIPAALPASYQQLMTGALDGQWVEIQGVVRQYFGSWTNSDVRRIVVSVDGGRVPVRFAEGSHPELIAVDSVVRTRAICYSQFNQNRQMLNPVLEVPRGEPVVVVSSPPADPYAVPVSAAAGLRSFSPDNLRAYTHRVHVRGVVSSLQAGSCVWIRDDATGLRLETRQDVGELRPGDQIEALGFLALGSYPPTLEDSVFRKIGLGAPPAPVAIASFNQALDHQNDLVAIEAMLVQIQAVSEGITLTLQKDKQSFEAVLRTSGPVNRLARPAACQPGSRVRVVGICSSVYDDLRPYAGIWQPKTFQILLRSPDDLTVISRPPWWTPQHTILVLGGMIAALLLATSAGMWRARRRLNEQRRQRAMAEAEFSAILSERNRMAREIHDTLAQGLVATSVQLRLARKHSAAASESLRHHLDSAQQLVRSSLQEARNSIWNMRAQVLENGDLSSALKGILKQMADDTELETHFEIIGDEHRLAPVVESNLLRVGQEAITNATKHAQAKHIKVRLEFGEKQFRLMVSDDGRGFDPAKPQQGTGGFGLVGMRERAAELQGKLAVSSAPGQGSEISLIIPLSEN